MLVAALGIDSERFKHPLGLTGDQSSNLKIGDRVCWKANATNLGTVASNGWGGVVIEWDDGHNSSIHHNDMAQVERVPNSDLIA